MDNIDEDYCFVWAENVHSQDKTGLHITESQPHLSGD